MLQRTMVVKQDSVDCGWSMWKLSDKNQILANDVSSSMLHYAQIALFLGGCRVVLSLAVDDYIPLILMFYLDGLCTHRSSLIPAWYVST